MGAMRISLTSFDSLRISISAIPGMTCGTRTVTNNLYGPALPSRKTSGLPTWAETGSAQAARTAKIATKRFIGIQLRLLPADGTNPISRRGSQPAAENREEHRFRHDHPECECRVIDGHKKVPHVEAIRRSEISE